MSRFAGAKPDAFLQVKNKYFPIADPAGMGRAGNCLNRGLKITVIHGNFKFYIMSLSSNFCAKI